MVFRSEDMVLFEVFIPIEVSYSVLSVLGEMDIVEFKDLNEFNMKGRRYISEIQMCEELEGKIFYLHNQVLDLNMRLKTYTDNPTAPNPRQLIDMMTPGTADFDLLRKLYNEVKEIGSNLGPLEKTANLHLEYQAILKSACNLLFQRGQLPDLELGHDLNVYVIGGVISQSKWNGFERALWRICHGNYVLQFSDCPSVNEHDPLRRLFVILVHGRVLKDTITKLTLSFGADIYDVPESRMLCNRLNMKNKSDLADMKKVLATTREHYHRVLKVAADNLPRWLMEVKKMKLIYHTMNKFNTDKTETFLRARCWVPKNSVISLKEILDMECKKSNNDVKPMMFETDPGNDCYPTYFRLNKFTRSFQNIIDAYGIANYKELNPLPYTIITFPFLFSVMFGDIGHGSILTISALVLIIKEKQIASSKNMGEVVSMIFGGRYIILLMGLFSMFTGCIYNDVFGFFINFGTHWELPAPGADKTIFLDPKTQFSGSPYPYGMDPIWRFANNEINVYNSLKMKLSIVLGVTQMLLGIWLSLLNMIYFKDYISIYSDFIPQLIFFGGLFGYFVFLIVFKWCSYGTDFPPERGPSCAPSIIISFFNMVLFSGTEGIPGCDLFWYPAQMLVEIVIVFSALICVPCMLIIKPSYFLCSHAPHREKNTMIMPENKDKANEKILFDNISNKTEEFKGDVGHSHTEKESTMDLIIHQIIHTIEFVLGTISYTASYLRLWALSLAHEKLSHVLKSLVFDLTLDVSMSLPIYIAPVVVALGFCFWAFLSVAILIIMEGLSAFLHALRLHWMEFQSKFYAGSGYPFTPFTLKTVNKEAAKELTSY